MRIDTNGVAKQIANNIISKVDAMPHLMNKLDFTDAGDQDSAVRDELDFLLDGGLTVKKYEVMLEELLEHDYIIEAFDTANEMLKEYRRELENHRLEAREQIREYVRSIL